MKPLRHTALALLIAFSLLSSPVGATSFSTDQSDLWYIVAESGWGMQLVQRGNTIFATLFVYGQSSAPTWYVATMVPTATQFQWSGDLYATTGPWFGTTPFNPADVTATKVGTMTWTAQTNDTGNVAYTVNGVQVSKSVVRQTLVFDDYNGTYLGAFHIDVTGCSNPMNNVSNVESFGTTTITQVGQVFTLNFVQFAPGGVTFTVTGTLSQGGQFGDVSGNYTSNVGELGSAELTEATVQIDVFSTRYSFNSTNNGCHDTGYIAGIRSRT